MNYIISEAFNKLKQLEEDSQNKKAQAISNFISRRSSELNSEKGAQIASNEFSFAGMSNEEAVRKMNDLGEGHYEMYQEELPGNFWTNGAPVIKKYIKKVEYKDKYLDTLEEDRFSYDKEQEFTSKSTAHGNGVANKGQGRVPALFKNIRDWRSGTTNFDYGCGESTTQAQIANFLADKGVEYIGFDKYNQTAKEQNAALDRLDEMGGHTDTATCANVLNVVKEKDIRVNEIIANIYSILKPGGTAYFDVYVGSGAGAGTGQGRPTGGDKYQTFMKLEDYAEEIGEVFGQDNVEVKGKLIVAKK